jgi:hypothetical protein
VVSTPVRQDNTSPSGRLQITDPYSVLSRGNSDPFDSTVIPLSALNAHCHRLAREFQVGNIWGEELVSDEMRASTLNWWLGDSTTIKNTTAMQGLLAWAYTVSLSLSKSGELSLVAVDLLHSCSVSSPGLVTPSLLYTLTDGCCSKSFVYLSQLLESQHIDRLGTAFVAPFDTHCS